MTAGNRAPRVRSRARYQRTATGLPIECLEGPKTLAFAGYHDNCWPEGFAVWGQIVEMTNIGFIGLGIMGRPMAGHLVEAGYSLFAYSRSGVPDELLKKGATACLTSSHVARSADIIPFLATFGGSIRLD